MNRSTALLVVIGLALGAVLLVAAAATWFARSGAAGPLMVNVWASWCPPCRNEAPLLEAAWREYGDRVQFLGVALRDQESAATAFVEEFEMSFPSGMDPRGRVADTLGVVGVPTTYFIDRTGRIRSTSRRDRRRGSRTTHPSPLDR